MDDLSCKVKKLIEFIDNQNKPLIIAIEGKCASGKTTLAQQLKDKYQIIHVDDFFLPSHLKTKMRMEEVGGNINYEKIYDLLVNIKNNKVINYDRYDCHLDKYFNTSLPFSDVIILEGVYSYHPFFNRLIDKVVYLTIDNKTQACRIHLRPNAAKFFNEWIPLENKYFDKMDFLNNADLIL